MQTPTIDEAERAARALLAFIQASPTPFHAVRAVEEALEAAHFRRLDERESWRLEAGGRYWVSRADSSLIAFIVGTRDPAEAGFRVVGAHTDSPNLRLKPKGDLLAQGYRQLGVEVYGGVLLSTWTDRDLGLAGRLLIDSAAGLRSRLICVDRPIARVPMLAIHLDREVNERGLVLNKQTHMAPVFGLEGGRRLLDWLGAEIGLEAGEKIAGFDLMLFAIEAPTLGGVDGEFVFAPRLDNLGSCHAALEALLRGADSPASATRMIAFFDHEEVGSASPQGAAGSFQEDVFDRVRSALDLKGDAFHRAKARSLMISADMAHAVHPNYADRHEKDHMPRLNAGPVLKTNANMRYATDGRTGAEWARICREAEVPYQDFVMRSDLACGSTIGPLVATRLGMPTLDVGNPMLSMHSSREMAGTRDHHLMIRALARAFQS